LWANIRNGLRLMRGRVLIGLFTPAAPAWGGDSETARRRPVATVAPATSDRARSARGPLVRSHTSFDADQGPSPNPATRKLLTQNNRPLVIQADQIQRVLAVSIPTVLTTTASVPCDMAICSPCFRSPQRKPLRAKHGRSIPF
jgi:hypothetical protein